MRIALPLDLTRGGLARGAPAAAPAPRRIVASLVTGLCGGSQPPARPASAGTALRLPCLVPGGPRACEA